MKKLLTLLLTFAACVASAGAAPQLAPENKNYEDEWNSSGGATRPRRVSDQPQATPRPTPTPGTAPRPTPTPAPPAANDRALGEIRRLDQADRAQYGQLGNLTVEEHLRRAGIYHSNRAFSEAQAHWQAILDRYPNDPAVAQALFGMGRSNFQAQQYRQAQPYFQRLADQYPNTYDGREGRYYIAATLLRLGQFSQAAARYGDYIRQYPDGERIEAAHLNTIDTLREAGNNAAALNWVAATRARFPGTLTETNAVFAELRTELATGDWDSAVRSADELRGLRFGKDVMTDSTEIAFLRAYALERAGRTNEAVAGYLAVPDRAGTYHGSLATARLQQLAPARQDVKDRVARVTREIRATAAAHPVKFRAEVLRATQQQGIDPRLVLAIMKQESGFNPNAKSPSAARGLLQLVIDTARKFGPRAGYNDFREDDLYKPAVNTAIGSAYIAELQNMFPDNPEAVAASFNGGEENVRRWVNRANNPDSGLFAAEVGFTETKAYVFKVMGNYRAYKTLYTNDLRAR